MYLLPMISAFKLMDMILNILAWFANKTIYHMAMAELFINTKEDLLMDNLKMVFLMDT